MTLKIKYNRLRGGLYLLLLLALPLFSLGDTDNKQLFEQGNAQYANAQYQQSIKTYMQILDGGYQSAAVYFNLGNAYFKLNDMPSALLYYEKAHKLTPGDADININIQLANLKITDKVDQAPEFFIFSKWWRGLILLVSANTLAIFSILFFLAGFLLLVLYLFGSSPAIKQTAFYSGILFIFVGLIAIFVAGRQVDYFNSHHEAIVFSSTVTVKSTPDGNAKALFVVHEGTKVSVLEIVNNWIEVQLPNGNTGWITTGDVKDI